MTDHPRMLTAAGMLMFLVIQATSAHQGSHEPASKIDPRFQVNIAPYPYNTDPTGTEDVELEIVQFNVPEKRINGWDKTVRLSYLRFKTTNPEPGPPIVYLAGGPGGSGISAASGPRRKLFLSLRSVADVIAFDQRGTGLSNETPPCPHRLAYGLDQPAEFQPLLAAMREQIAKCEPFWRENDVDLSAYNTNESADDLADLAKVLETDHIQLWGISYGTHLGLAAIRRHENMIHRAVFASVEGPDQSIKYPNDVQNLLMHIADLIRSDEAAFEKYPDLLGKMNSVLDDLEEKPRTVKVKTESGREISVAFGKLDVQLVTSFLILKNPSMSRHLPRVFYDLDAGNNEEMGKWVLGLRHYMSQIEAMPLAMDAASGVSKKRWRKIKRQAKKSLLGRSTNFPYPDISKAVDVPDLGKAFRRNVDSEVPVLFFNGTLDGRTFISDARDVIRGFSNAKHVIIDNAGHDLFLSVDEVEHIMLDWFADKEFDAQTMILSAPEIEFQ